ncbi:MAG: hypothetical protein HGA93_03155, partial [Methanothrix sp.]|nr:hypothetical protein [Methanothrix sp.]
MKLVFLHEILAGEPPCANDAEKTARFLNHVFGWQIDYHQALNEKRIKIGKGSAGFDGGVFTLENTSPLYLTIYIRVEDI